MSWDGVVDDDAAVAAMDGLDAALDAVAALRFDAMTNLQRLAVLNRYEASARRMPAIDHQLIARLSAEASPVELGAKSMTEVLVARLRISRDDAQRRLGEAADLGPRTALTGEPLQPALAKVAAAQAAGLIGQDHVEIIRKFFTKLPGWVDPTTREQAEDNLVRVAEGFNPDALRKAAAKLMAYLDQDGPMPNDAERARRRHITIGRQAPDGMSKISGVLDPQARATWEAWTAKLAAPGMCNPDDDTPCTSGTPSQAHIDGDQRTPGQRNHDALTAMGRSVLSSGELGQHNGLPVTIIVSTTLQDLESAAGVAVTGGGSLLPTPDLIRMASHAHHYLAVFDKHTGESLYLGRTRRCASPAQRIVLHARDRGCTKPGCTTPGYWCQVHHVDGWAADGQTNVDDLTLACGPDNRSVEQGGWTTRRRKDGVIQWIPPPHLDTGQARTNVYHHPERMLVDPAEDDEVETADEGAEPNAEGDAA